MKIKTLLLLLAVLNSFSMAFAQPTEEKAVRETFNAYKAAILADKSEDAVNAVDSRTLKYYTDMLELTKTADSNTIESRPLIDKLMILILRHRATKDELLAMKGHDAFVFAIKNGMVSKGGVVNTAIGKVTLSNLFAKGEALVEGKPTPLFFEFHKENNQWKIDLTSLFPIANTAFRQMVEDSGEKENDFLFTVLTNLTGKTPDPGIWNKLN
jgi:hypothetical protein